MKYPVTIVHLVHPHPFECAAVAEWLEKRTFIQLNGQSSSLESLSRSSELGETDIAIVFAYCTEDIARQIINIKKMQPRLRFLVVSATSSMAAVREVIHAGVTGYMGLDAEIEEWEWAIKSVSEGKIYYGQQVMVQLAEPPKDQQSQPVIQSAPTTKNFLSKRELEILRLVASEYSTNRIADALFISGKTVETHRRNLFQKLGVKNSVGLTKIAVRLGVV
ncbi:response regulator transcription factor [Dyadobacter sp. CY347]|uniref:response regulator transcription factor n=1 Tax=Dyadobacter sp. CY347 TaxID=2909336 RepID=UPI001F2006E2|nr:response regulator transcription factor [Dyadobacter sp. CY347]MCF2489268.1 response regulator transcription factor [Dyadobacter sp. CY347]